MFVRRKHNKSGTTSIQVVAKADGKYRVQKSFGIALTKYRLACVMQPQCFTPVTTWYPLKPSRTR